MKTVFAALLVVALALPAAWSANANAGRKGGCLECHGQRGIQVSFGDGSIREAYVEPGRYADSVHGSMPCSSCHEDFSGGAHPERNFRSAEQYEVRSCLPCRRCHQDCDLRENPLHLQLLDREIEGKYPLCVNCHEAHAIKPVVHGEVATSEERYCQKCHAYKLHAALADGRELSLDVDTEEIKNSVHKVLSCSDCHFGFSSEAHPRKKFSNRREYTIASSEVCRRCHFDKYSKTLESIHYFMLSQGNLKAPVCTDCHGSHGVQNVHVSRTSSALKCQRCHPRIYDTYAMSVHGSALFNESNRDVPACIDCHKSHDIVSPLSAEYREKIPQMCSNCHEDSSVVGRYGLSTDVVKTYLSDFHGRTLEIYRLQGEGNKPHRPIAVCTDCHGIHDIRSTVGVSPALLKRNLLERCRKCHQGASENFPDAWLSHYVPSLANAPVVFVVNLAYKLFIPFLMAGLVLQILLHVWRYLVDR